MPRNSRFNSLRDSPWLARGQNVQGESLSELNLEFLGILIRRHVGESRRTIGDSDSSKRLALYGESNRYGGIGGKEESGAVVFFPPLKKRKALGLPAPPGRFLCGPPVFWLVPPPGEPR